METVTVAIRIQPAEVDIPDSLKGDPFANDLLNRKEPAEILTHLISSIEGPCVLSVDGAWGSGKTTFLRMWTQHLINQGFPVVTFNAWETDYSAAPFISLAAALGSGSHLSQDGSTSKTRERFRDLAKKIAPWTMPLLSAAALAGVGAAGADAAVVGSLSQALTSAASTRFDRFPEAQQSVEEFKASFIEMAVETFTGYGNKPLIVAIDELDRCRPTFAIELLETAKHLFSADHVVFVLTMNRQELAHSIKAVYGDHFDADGYLRRFIDIDFRLPSPERQPFVEHLLRTTGIDADIEHNVADGAAKSTYQMLFRWLYADDRMSIRTVSQSVHHLSLVLASLPRDRRIHIEMVAIALWLRAVDWHLYVRFVAGEASDAEYVDAVFREPLPASHPFSSIRAVLEALVISISAERQRRPLYASVDADTPLMRRYVELRDGTQPGARQPTSVEREHAANVLRSLDGLKSSPRQLHPYDEFKLVSHRIDLLSHELVERAFTT